MSRKEMAGVLDLVPDLRKHKGVVLGMLDNKAVCIPEIPISTAIWLCMAPAAA